MSAAGLVSEFDTVILAGGSAARMAGADKPGLAVGGTAMLVSVAQAAVSAGTRRLIIVGPQRAGTVQDSLARAAASLPGSMVCVREEPPGSGPLAALRRGLTEVSAPWLALLAADLPFLAGADLTGMLAAGLTGDEACGEVGDEVGDHGPGAGQAGVVLVDDDGRPQWLAGVWRAGPLRTALLGYGGRSLHGLLAPLDPVPMRLPVAGPGAPWLDCDTPDDLAAARRAFSAFSARASSRAVITRTERHDDAGQLDHGRLR